MQHYAIQFVSDFFPGTPVSTNKTDSHDIAEVLLKVALNTMTLTLQHHSRNVGFLITGTMLMEILRERKIIIQKKLRYTF
jgi:meiotically up-regulated gene 157 (Mug157) protein